VNSVLFLYICVSLSISAILVNILNWLPIHLILISISFIHIFIHSSVVLFGLAESEIKVLSCSSFTFYSLCKSAQFHIVRLASQFFHFLSVSRATTPLPAPVVDEGGAERSTICTENDSVVDHYGSDDRYCT
jgi:hypothetical protein